MAKIVIQLLFFIFQVSRRFNEICASMLNSTFQRLQSQMLSRFQEIKTQMPRRESARRYHFTEPHRYRMIHRNRPYRRTLLSIVEFIKYSAISI